MPKKKDYATGGKRRHSIMKHAAIARADKRERREEDDYISCYTRRIK